MQKQGAVAIGTFLLVAAWAAMPGDAAPDEDELVHRLVQGDVYTQEELIGMGFDRWIVAFHGLPEDRETYAGHPVVDVLEGLRILVVRAPEPVTLQAHAMSDENVRYVEYDDPLYGHLLYTPDDPLHNSDSGLWGTHRVGAEAAWDHTLGSTAVKIAVVDSGLNADHEEFAGQSRVLGGWNFHGDNSDTSDSSSCSFHGTHVSGTLGATTDNGVGMAGLSQSTILPAKIFDSSAFGCGAASTSSIANALMFAGDEGAHISQNSWGGGGSSSTINDAIAYAHGLGTTHVAAAGNSGPCSDCVNQPWVENAAIVNIVSSIDSDDSFSSFSSQGPQVTVTAPGGSVKSTTSGTGSYGTLSGTSMAAPHVSGSLGLYLADNGDVGFDELENVLTSTAEDLGHSSDQQGAGLVRVDLMLEAGDGVPDPQGPSASFTHDCTDTSCDFDASSSTPGDAPISSYDWDFGDGNTGSGESASHTYTEGGTYTVTLTVTDSDGLQDTNSQSIPVGDGGNGPLFAEDFSDGSAPGWQKSSMSNDLWRVADDCADTAVPTHQLAFSRGSPDCDYDVGTAQGWIRSPVVDASGQSVLELSFSHFFEVESFSGEYDVMRVQVTSDGSTWDTLDQWDARDGTNGGHTLVSYDISAYASSGLQVRYYFDSVDSVSNGFPGWYVDDVVVTGDGDGGEPDPTGPTASFTHSCTDLDCGFDASSSTAGDAPISSYAWDFGDGNTGSGQTASHGYAAGGTYTVTLTVTDDNGLSDSTSDSVVVEEPQETVLYGEDFSDGTADGWHKSSMSNDLWRVADDCADTAVPTHQLAFSRGSPDCDYDVGTAEGWARSPVVDASGQSSLELSFSHFFEVESFSGEYDVMRVQVTSDGSTWDTLDQWDARDGTNGGHTLVSYDISAYASSGLQVRFYFDSVDGVSNDNPGWYVDDVLVKAT